MVVVAMVHTCTHNALRYAEITTICCLLLPCLFVWILAVGFLLPCLWWCVTFCLIHSILRCPTTLTMLSRTIMASQGPLWDRCDCAFLLLCLWIWRLQIATTATTANSATAVHPCWQCIFFLFYLFFSMCWIILFFYIVLFIFVSLHRTSTVLTRIPWVVWSSQLCFWYCLSKVAHDYNFPLEFCISSAAQLGLPPPVDCDTQLSRLMSGDQVCEKDGDACEWL